MRRPRALRRLVALLLLAALGAAASGCAYYNTFYLARKYYLRATLGWPYPIEGSSQMNAQNYNKSIDYSKKLLANYPKSKWVDDAYLMWARGLIGRDDPLQTVSMLRDFTTKYPNSPVAPDARFYLGVAYRASRNYTQAVVEFDGFLEKSPKHEMAQYAHYERARCLLALKRPAEAADAVATVLDRWPKSPLVDRARSLRAEARFAAQQYDWARRDYIYMGSHARTDDERLEFLLREVDCIEAARNYDEAIALLDDALSHVTVPVHQDTTGGRIYQAPVGLGADHFGRLTLRRGTVQLLAGRLDDALTDYRRVVEDYPRTPLAAEAQYRIGYAYETEGDDFPRAREAYAKVRDQGGSTGFIQQAASRLANLDQLEKFKSAGGDSLTRIAEAGFLLAEQYLFQVDRPQRALETYARLADSLKGTPWAGKALNAQAWVLSRKLDRKAAADSLFWKVVHEYPATEAQLAARDYLEMEGHTVPAGLIKYPEKKIEAPPDTVPLTPPPAAVPFGLTPARSGVPDSLGMPRRPPGPGTMFPVGRDSMRFAPFGRTPQAVSPFDTLGRGGFGPAPPAAPDTVRRPGGAPAPVPAPTDTSRGSGNAPPAAPALPDTTRRH